jgi:D-alanyl-D-alanine carboxypeptidase (penicillin-binding protein 5/6)
MHRPAHPSLLVAVVTVFLAIVVVTPAAELAAAEPAVRTATVKKAARVAVKPAAKTVAAKKTATRAKATKAAKATVGKKKSGATHATAVAAKKKSTPPARTVNKGRTRSTPALAAGKQTRAGKKAVAKKTASRRPAAVTTAAAAAAVGGGDVSGQVSSKSFMVMDAATGATICAKAPDSPRQPASTIKIVTAMIALKSLGQNDVIHVSRRAADMPSSKIYLSPDQRYQANDMINAVLLASANDASVALAENIAGSEEKFAALMTLSARLWGAKNTVCRTASGLTAEGQQSTARDLANLFRFAMQDTEFSRRMHERKIDTSYGKTLVNHNKALWRVDGAVGGKTGYTIAARQTYVGQFTRGGDSIVVAIMGSESMWSDLNRLVDYGFRRKKQEQLAQLRRTVALQGEVGLN